jgi:hypothetical protein
MEPFLRIMEDSYLAEVGVAPALTTKKDQAECRYTPYAYNTMAKDLSWEVSLSAVGL